MILHSEDHLIFSIFHTVKSNWVVVSWGITVHDINPSSKKRLTAWPVLAARLLICRVPSGKQQLWHTTEIASHVLEFCMLDKQVLMQISRKFWSKFSIIDCPLSRKHLYYYIVFLLLSLYYCCCCCINLFISWSNIIGIAQPIIMYINLFPLSRSCPRVMPSQLWGHSGWVPSPRHQQHPGLGLCEGCWRLCTAQPSTTQAAWWKLLYSWG